MTKKTIAELFEEHNQMLREQNRLLARSNDIQAQPRAKNAWVCGSWPHCYHGSIIGGIFGCAGAR